MVTAQDRAIDRATVAQRSRPDPTTNVAGTFAPSEGGGLIHSKTRISAKEFAALRDRRNNKAAAQQTENDQVSRTVVAISEASAALADAYRLK